MPKDSRDPIGRLEDAFTKVTAAEPIEKKVHAAQKAGTIGGESDEQRISNALARGVIDAREAELLRDANRARLDVIKVDDFASEELSRSNK